jgi:hypothetical protein
MRGNLRRAGDSDVYAKTATGHAEIGRRSRRLSATLHAVLLLVDGCRDVRTLRGLCTGLRAPADAVERLLDLNLIGEPEAGAVPDPREASEAAVRYTLWSHILSDAVRTHLGLRGFFLQLRIERCHSAEDLDALVPAIAAEIARRRGSRIAQAWTSEIGKLMLDALWMAVPSDGARDG